MMDSDRSSNNNDPRNPIWSDPSSESDSSDDQQGTFFLGRYRVVDEIGVGGMATVHLARIDGFGGFQKWVAIKRIHPHLTEDEQFIHMFLDEARIAASISHPHVAQVFELGQDGDTFWIAMEYLHGEPLREIMRVTDAISTPMSAELAARIIADAAEGLHAAHELRGKNGEILNLVHRDVTPHNLFITYDGMVKVVDFGIAKVAGRLSNTQAGTLKGKVAYMSPEQVMGRSVDRRTDIFALGVVLWELTTGVRLFRMDTDTDTLEKVAACIIPPPSLIAAEHPSRLGAPDASVYPPALEAIVMRALQKGPDARFQTARELSRALQEYLLHAGRVVGPEEVGTYVKDLFKDRIRERDEHLRWAAEVTKTMSIDKWKPKKDADCVEISEISEQMPQTKPPLKALRPATSDPRFPAQARLSRPVIPSDPTLERTSPVDFHARMTVPHAGVRAPTGRSRPEGPPLLPGRKPAPARPSAPAVPSGAAQAEDAAESPSVREVYQPPRRHAPSTDVSSEPSVVLRDHVPPIQVDVDVDVIYADDGPDSLDEDAIQTMVATPSNLGPRGPMPDFGPSNMPRHTAESAPTVSARAPSRRPIEILPSKAAEIQPRPAPQRVRRFNTLVSGQSPVSNRGAKSNELSDLLDVSDPDDSEIMETRTFASDLARAAAIDVQGETNVVELIQEPSADSQDHAGLQRPSATALSRMAATGASAAARSRTNTRWPVYRAVIIGGVAGIIGVLVLVIATRSRSPQELANAPATTSPSGVAPAPSAIASLTSPAAIASALQVAAQGASSASAAPTATAMQAANSTETSRPPATPKPIQPRETTRSEAPAPLDVAMPGYLTIVCDPACDEVIAGGRSLGSSPIVRARLGPGQYRVTLRRTGSTTKVVPIIIVSGQVTATRVSML